MILDNSDPERQQQYLWDKGITNDKLVELGVTYKSLIDQISEYHSKPDLTEADKYFLEHTRNALVTINVIARKISAGEIRLLNSYPQINDPRVSDLVKSYYGSEEELRKRGWDSPVGEVLVLTIGEDGNLDLEAPIQERVDLLNPFTPFR